MESDKTLVLVCGAARSGTTMLDLMLGNSDEAFSTGEIYALFRPFRKHHFDPVCSCGDKHCNVWVSLQHVPEHQFHRRASEQPGIRYVVDSSKDLRWVLDSNRWAADSGLQVRNLLIWKDPVDLAYSHWKRGRPVDYYRKAFLDYYQRFLALELPFVSVSYTQLVTHNQRELAALCEYLGMDYDDGRAEFWNKQHHHFFGSAGTATQVEKGSSTLGLNRDFPEEFVAQFEASLESRDGDETIARLIGQLERHQLDQGGKPGDSAAKPKTIKPGWYYRHVLKAHFRRYFPEREEVVD